MRKFLKTWFLAAGIGFGCWGALVAYNWLLAQLAAIPKTTTTYVIVVFGLITFAAIGIRFLDSIGRPGTITIREEE